MYSLKIYMKFFIEVFPMIFQNLMGPRKSRCNVPSGPPKHAFAQTTLNHVVI
jgi:hypothetical protein